MHAAPAQIGMRPAWPGILDQLQFSGTAGSAPGGKSSYQRLPPRTNSVAMNGSVFMLSGSKTMTMFWWYRRLRRALPCNRSTREQARSTSSLIGFDHNISIEHRVRRQIDFTHATAPDEADDLVFRQSPRDSARDRFRSGA